MMDLVCFGQQNWDYCWTGKQQLMTRLARRGYRVLYLDPDWVQNGASLREAARYLPERKGAGLREIEPNLHVLTCDYVPALRWRLNQQRYRACIGRAAEQLGLQAPIAFTLRPHTRELLEGLRPSARVYYCVDEMRAFGLTPAAQEQPDWAEEPWRREVREQEEALLKSVDLALGVSPRLVRRFSQLQPRSYLLENGADIAHFAPERLARTKAHPLLVGLPYPRLGFVGQIDERLHQPLLVELARARRGWQIVLAGRVKPGVDVAGLEAEPNIHLIGYQPYESLPSVLRELDVCLVPYHLTELTHSCNPLKVFEYLATGLPVVSSPLDGLLACREAISLATSTPEFLQAVEAALVDGGRGRERRLAVAAANSWDRRVDDLERRLAEAVEAARRKQRSAGAGAEAARGQTALPIQLSADNSRSYLEIDQPLRLTRVLFLATRAAGRVYHAGRVLGRRALGKRPSRVRRILVARHCRLGDLVVFLPTLAALRARFPHARIVLGTQPGMSAGAVLARSQDVDEIRPLSHLSQPSAAGRLRGVVRLFAEGYDVVVSGTSFFLIREALLCGAPDRIGLADGHLIQAWNNRRVVLDPTIHEAENDLAAVELAGATAENGARVPALSLDPEAVAVGGARLAEALGLQPGAPLLAIHPGAQKPSRRWPAEAFTAVVTRLLSERPALRVVFSGTPNEAELVESIRAGVPEPLRGRTASAVGLTDLPSLVGLLDRSDLLICNDTGIMHLARAQGTPLLALLGPEEDRRWGPHPLGRGTAVALRHVVPCAPCQRWECNTHECLRSLSVEQVTAEASRILDASTERKHSRNVQGNGAAVEHLEPLLLQSTHHSWSDLREAGRAVPLVSVVLFTDPSVPEATRESLAAVARQDYPALEVLQVQVGSPTAITTEPVLSSGAPVISVGAPDDPVRAWQAAVEHARGEFIAPLVAGRSWDAGKVSSAVATLRRVPEAEAASGRLHLLSSRAVSVADLGVVRRSVVERLLSSGEADDGAGLRGWLTTDAAGVPIGLVVDPAETHTILRRALLAIERRAPSYRRGATGGCSAE